MNFIAIFELQGFAKFLIKLSKFKASPTADCIKHNSKEALLCALSYKSEFMLAIYLIAFKKLLNIPPIIFLFIGNYVSQFP